MRRPASSRHSERTAGNVGVRAAKQRAIEAGVFHPPLCGGLPSSPVRESEEDA